MRRVVLVMVLLLTAAPSAHAADDLDGDTLLFAFTGDVLTHLNVNSAARRHGTPYDFRPLFEPVRHLISGADFSVCHLEVPLSPDNSRITSFPRFSGPRQLADALTYAGFDACSTASNHTIDQGVDGALATRQILESAGLAQSGIRRSVLEIWNDPVYDVRGVEVAHISATYWYNGLRPPRGMEWISSEIDVDDILYRARRAKSLGADLVVVSMHCCVEYRTMPTPRQIEDSHRLIQSPHVDLVVTHHAHVVGPVEKVGDEFVLHGLGNFLSGQVFQPETRDGVIAVIRAKRTDGVWRFDRVEVIPTEVGGGSVITPVPRGSASWQRTMSAINAMGAEIQPFPGHVRRGARLDLWD
ncbi:MAG TPA: CapA family protein [Acidimicrobiia bacterium]|nr:CapA family protein [Acidimicrobiia bacterium]